MRLVLGQADQEVPILLLSAAGARLTGLAPADILVKVWKQGFEGFGQTEREHPVRELGFGWYAYAVGATDMDTEGVAVLRATHAESVPSETVLDVVRVAAEPPATARPIGSEGV